MRHAPLGGHDTEVGPGDVLCIPRGTVHRFENRGDVDATALAIVTPGILGPDYFREVAAVVAAAAFLLLLAQLEVAGRLAELPRGVEVVAYCRGPFCVYADDAVRLLRRRRAAVMI